MAGLELNADLGEYPDNGAHDTALMRLITRANIACGGHAGDSHSMRIALGQAKAARVLVGAHPSYEDRENFGRRELGLSVAEILPVLVRQIEALRVLAAELDMTVDHVKPHGALYNRAADDRELADALATLLRRIDPQLALLGLAGSEMQFSAERARIRFIPEAFADRAYLGNGRLVPRNQPGAVLDQAAALRQAEQLQQGMVRTIDGGTLPIAAESLCVHGDGDSALALLKALRERQLLASAPFRLRS